MNTTQPQGPFCQSCAMPMVKSEDFGTNADGSKNKEYCGYCFQKGKFTEPDITMEQMIEKCSGLMRRAMKFATSLPLSVCLHLPPRFHKWKLGR